jgi:acetyl-CoA synthetase/medium-chain acyl-CoA synthetase
VEAPPLYNFSSDVIDCWARERPGAPALWWLNADGKGEARLTFRELAAASRRAANVFRAGGVRRGDRVMVVLPRVPQWWISLLGLIRLGAVAVPGTPMLTTHDLAYRSAAAEVSAVVTDPPGLARLGEFRGARFVVGGGEDGTVDFDAGMRAATDEFAAEPTASGDPCLIYFTSATTGQPKMVLHTQASYGLGHKVTGELWLDLKPGDVHWNLSDVGWAKAAWSSFFGPWLAGACVFAVDWHGRFNPHTALAVLENHPVTTWCAPPTALRLIVREGLGRRKFPALRHCVTAGEPLQAEVFAAWESATGLTLHEGYGQTETVVMVGNFRSLGRAVRPGSMGHATPGMEVTLLDEDLREVPAGEEGEVALRVKPRRPVGLFAGYWRNPEETAAHFRGDWYLTGDRARKDAEGYHWFVGRSDDVIKSSGYRIGPGEIEDVLEKHPAVQEAAVVGVPDEMRGQAVKAFVVLRPGHAGDEAMRRDLQEHCRRHTAPYKHPRHVEFRGPLPRTISGKVRRAELRNGPKAEG